MPTNSNYGAEKSSGALPRSGCRGQPKGKTSKMHVGRPLTICEYL